MSRWRTDSGIWVSEVWTGVLNASCHSCSVFGGHHEEWLKPLILFAVFVLFCVFQVYCCPDSGYYTHVLRLLYPCSDFVELRGSSIFRFNMIATWWVETHWLRSRSVLRSAYIRVAVCLPMTRFCRARGSHIFRYKIFSTYMSWSSFGSQVTPHIFLCRNVSDTNKYISRILPQV